MHGNLQTNNPMILQNKQTKSPSESKPKEQQIRNFGVENRAALNNELNGIQGLDRLVYVASFANNDKPKQTPNVQEQERTLRENLARSGVASSLVKERKLSRQLARSGRKGTKMAEHRSWN